MKDLHRDGTVVIMVSGDGLLASILTCGADDVVDSVQVTYNLIATDLRMLVRGVSGGRVRVALDEHPLRWASRRRSSPGRWPWRRQVQLTAVHAFARPIVPWRYPVWAPVGVEPGPDTHRIVVALPDDVRRQFGPHLASS